MIQLYNKGQTDFSRKGIALHAQTAAVTFQDNGRFDLDLTMPVQERISLDYGMIIRCSVPEQHVPAITLGMVSYYTVSNAEGTTLWSEIPTQKRVRYNQWTYGTQEEQKIYSVGAKVTYKNNNYKCVYFDAADQGYMVPPDNSSWWERISNTTGKPGKAAAELAGGTVLMKTADFNDEYMEAATTDGKSGYIRLADAAATGESEQRTIPAQTITEQNFVITEIEKSSDGKQVTLHAEHVSYGLGRVMLGDCNLVGVNPATAVLFIQGAMKESYPGGIYTNLSDGAITADFSWKNAQNAILDPKAGLLQFTAGQMIRNDENVYLITKGEATPKYKIKYGINLTAVKWDGSVSGLVTRIYPTAQTEDGETLLLPEEHIDTVRIIPFIRPEVLNTGLKVGATEKQSDGTEIELTEEIIFERMRTAAYNRFNVDECDKTDITLEVDWIHLPDTEEYKPYAALKNAAPGEWVQVEDGPLGVSEIIQLTGYTFDPILGRYEKCTFGKNKVSSGVAGYEIQTGAISGRALAAGAVSGQNIQADTITAREIEAGSITADKIATRSLTAETIAANAITAEAISAGSVTAEKVAAYAITAEKIAAYAITAEKIAANAITAGAIAAAAIQAEHIASEAITTQKIAAGAVDATRIAALAITSDKISAGAVTAEKIGAGAITAAKIDTTDLAAINAILGTANIARAEIAAADIDYAKVKDLNAQSAYFGQAVIQEGLANKLFIPRLSVDYAQIVSATIGDLVIQATDDNFYKLDVDLAGNVTATRITPTQEEIDAGHTTDGRTIYLGTDIVASDLNTTNIYASHALMDEITAAVINTDQLFAREATISKINALDLSSNTYIRSTIGDWQSGSTITQTINGISSRISSLGYGTIFYSTTEPDPTGVVVGDVWIEPIEDNTWDDVAQFTWDELGGMTWEQVAGQYRMYVWTGLAWKLLFDNMIVSELQTQINQNAYAITLKADETLVDALSGQVTAFGATLEVQAEAIRAAVSAVNAKTANYTRLTDPADDPAISLSVGDTWTKAAGNGTWGGLENFTWDELSAMTWDEIGGASVYSWTGNEWILISDTGAQLNLQTIVEQTNSKVSVMAEEILTIGDRIYENSARITVEADRITQEVTRAQNAENGKISKTTQYQTADEIVSEAVRESASSASGIYMAKTTQYQTPDAIVSAAVAQAASGASGLYIAKTTSYQTAESIVNEAVRQSGVNTANGFIAKTTSYQTADAIVNTAEAYAAQVASEAEAAAKNASIARTNDYATVNAILNEAQNKADAAATTAKNASIAKTQQYQTADAIVSSAVALAATAAGSTYIAKTTTYQTADAIVATAERYTDNNAYGKVSGITITASGIDISGSQYVHIASGGNFKVTTGDFLIDTSVDNAGYVILSGSATAANASFRVKKNGAVTLTKLLALDADGNETEVNLRTSGLWKLAYKTVKATTISGNYCTSMTFSDGTSVNFSSAAAVRLEDSWTAGGTSAEYRVQTTNTPTTQLIRFGMEYGTIRRVPLTYTYNVPVMAQGQIRMLGAGIVDATEIYTEGHEEGYTKGWNDCVDAIRATALVQGYRTGGTYYQTLYAYILDDYYPRNNCYVGQTTVQVTTYTVPAKK